MTLGLPKIFAALKLPLAVLLVGLVAGGAFAQQTGDAVPASNADAAAVNNADPIDNPAGLPNLTGIAPDLNNSRDFSTTIQILLMLTVLSLAPSILMMMTSFTRIVIVLGLLRQAMATQQLPPNQVLVGLALFMTFIVMAPVYNNINDNALQPYLDGEISQPQAFGVAVTQMRAFMINQVEAADNTDDVYLFLDSDIAAKDDLTWADVPTMTMIPAFIVSELKVAFLMGFRIYLPFLVIDMVISSVLISMGMLMLPPVLISLPFKLLLFVLVDGWHLVVRTMMASFS